MPFARYAPAQSSRLLPLSLALAIGANTRSSVSSTVCCRPLPVADPGRLVTITSDFALNHGFKAGLG
jgi:hypothetical protein